jgi:DNA polymerase III subunit beta
MLEQNFEVTIKRSVFVKALSHIQSIVERKNISGIASHIKLEASDGVLTITATDGSVSLTENIFANTLHNSSLTLPAHTLYDIIRKFTEEEVHLKIDENQPSMVEINSGSSVFHLSFLKAEDFPNIDTGIFNNDFTMPISSMQKIIEKNRQTISQEDSRFNLNGIYLHPVLTDNELRGTATDGHRLSSARLALPKEAKTMKPIIIPRKTIFELSKILADHDKEKELRIEVSEVKIRFSAGDVVMVSKLVEGDFPDYLPLIPYRNSLQFSLPSTELLKTVDRTTTILMEKSQAIDFHVSGDRLEITVGGEHQSSANETLEVTSNMGEFNISFNAKYVLDILAAVGGGSNVIFKFHDQISPVLVQAEDDDKSDFVIMPMRI